MRGLIILFIVTAASAAPQGYNYHQESAVGSHVSGPSIGHSVGGGFSHGHSAHHEHHAHHQAPIVTKHIYIHSAPEETEEEARQELISQGPAHKNYHIVFIKAPSQSHSAAAISIAQAQNEEKTVIYVLSKKTDAADIQAAVQAAPVQPSKPEVFFIKYKTPEEAAHAQQQIQSQYDHLGGTTHVSDEGYAPVSSVIGALGGSSHHHHHTSLSSASHHVSAGTGYLPPN